MSRMGCREVLHLFVSGYLRFFALLTNDVHCVSENFGKWLKKMEFFCIC